MRQSFMMIVRMVVAIEQAVEHRAVTLIAEHDPGASLAVTAKSNRQTGSPSTDRPIASGFLIEQILG